MLGREAGCQADERASDTPSEDPVSLVLCLTLQLPSAHKLNPGSMNFQADVQTWSHSRYASFNKIRWEVRSGWSTEMKMLGHTPECWTGPLTYRDLK